MMSLITGATGRTLQLLKPPCTISAAQSYSVIPTVIDQLSFGEIAYDSFSKLLKERIVFISGPINDDTSHLVISQLLLLEFENPTEPIHMYLNSSGGAITAGHAASVASLLVAAGSKSERRSLPNATIMISQSSGWHSEDTKDQTIHTKQILQVSNKLSALYTKHTGQSIEVIEKSLHRANFMTSEEAKEFEIIDELIYQRHSDFKKLGF